MGDFSFNINVARVHTPLSCSLLRTLCYGIPTLGIPLGIPPTEYYRVLLRPSTIFYHCRSTEYYFVPLRTFASGDVRPPLRLHATVRARLVTSCPSRGGAGVHGSTLHPQGASSMTHRLAYQLESAN